jgi:hypothetical protein
MLVIHCSILLLESLLRVYGAMSLNTSWDLFSDLCCAKTTSNMKKALMLLSCTLGGSSFIFYIFEVYMGLKLLCPSTFFFSDNKPLSHPSRLILTNAAAFPSCFQSHLSPQYPKMFFTTKVIITAFFITYIPLILGAPVPDPIVGGVCFGSTATGCTLKQDHTREVGMIARKADPIVGGVCFGSSATGCKLTRGH